MEYISHGTVKRSNSGEGKGQRPCQSDNPTCWEMQYTILGETRIVGFLEMRQSIDQIGLVAEEADRGRLDAIVPLVLTDLDCPLP